VNENKTTKHGRTAGGVPIMTSSPAGHEEMSEQNAAEQQRESPRANEGKPKRRFGKTKLNQTLTFILVSVLVLGVIVSVVSGFRSPIAIWIFVSDGVLLFVAKFLSLCATRQPFERR
jgi:hypothetical protein